MLFPVFLLAACGEVEDTRPGKPVAQRQAAEILGLSLPTVGKLVKAGTLKLNRRGLIPAAEIDRAISGA
ncbi:MAG: helix-turn-helix domain-containing protein [Zoogloeaceae bacterium]|nr:helix-turn-helix domain-containing protein [Zoogloeaceae bacterium]